MIRGYTAHTSPEEISAGTNKKRVTIVTGANRQKLEMETRREEERETRGWIWVPLLGNEQGAESHRACWACCAVESRVSAGCTSHHQREKLTQAGRWPRPGSQHLIQGFQPIHATDSRDSPLNIEPCSDQPCFFFHLRFFFHLGSHHQFACSCLLPFCLRQLDTFHPCLFLCISCKPETQFHPHRRNVFTFLVSSASPPLNPVLQAEAGRCTMWDSGVQRERTV